MQSETEDNRERERKEKEREEKETRTDEEKKKRRDKEVYIQFFLIVWCSYNKTLSGAKKTYLSLTMKVSQSIKSKLA